MLYQHLEYWQWWAFGIVLIMLEMFISTSVLIWFGATAGLIGIIMVVFPHLSWQHQWEIFAVISVLNTITWRIFVYYNPPINNQPTSKRPSEQIVGRQFTLTEPIIDGRGKIEVDNTTWKVAGKDCLAGSEIKVTNFDRGLLEVELIRKAAESNKPPSYVEP